MAVFGAGWIVVAAIAEAVLSYRPLGSQLKADFSLSAKRAAQKAFGELQQALNSAPEFRQ